MLEFYPSSEHGPATIWVVPERDRHKSLYSISLTRVAALFRRVGLIILAASIDDDTRVLLLGAVAALVLLVVLTVFCWWRSRRDARESAERVALRAGLRLSIGT